MADYLSYYKPLPPKSIRLLTIHPGSQPDPVHVEFQEQLVNLSDDDENITPYEALSYVWGSEDNPMPLKFGPGGQSSHPVTPNLAEALHYLRYPEHARTIWIDAICIDQQNDGEKSTQVAMMGQVFQKARHVVAWLGLATDKTPRAIELIDEIGSQLDVVSWVPPIMRPSTTAHDPTLADKSVPLPYSAYDARCINDVLTRPWFRRLWVRQEVNLARSVSVNIGIYSTSWTHFSNTVFCLTAKSASTHPAFGGISQTVVAGYAYRVCRPGRYYYWSNLRLLLRGGYCKDHRDKLYAILSLLHPEESLGIVPDYSSSAAEVFRDAILKYLNKCKDVYFLDSCTLQNPAGRLPGLNSWVPDWSTDIEHSSFLFTAWAGSMFLTSSKYLGNGVLRLAGVECADVRAIEKIDHRDLATALSSVDRIFARISPERNVNQPYVTGGTVLDALCMTFLLNLFEWNFYPPHKSYSKFDRAKALIGTLRTRGSIPSDRNLAGLELGRHFRSLLRGWCFFTTVDHNTGAAVEGTQPGDQIVLFPGGTLPTVLRPLQDDKFQVVGSCYLHGVMQGEPLLGTLPAGVRQIAVRKDGYALRGYLDSQSGEIEVVDPRFRMRGIDVSAYETEVYKSGRIRMDARAIEDSGAKLVDFDLV